MRRPHFTESTYQFLALHELFGPLGLSSGMTVVVPTLREEAQLGYDASLEHACGTSVFIQFKRAHKRTRYSFRDRAIPNYSSIIQKPFWEFHIHNAAQHDLLCALSAWDDAYYFASLFEHQAELYAHARVGTVVPSSAQIDPSLSETVEDDDHRFLLWPDTKTWQFFSESRGKAKPFVDTETIQSRITARLRSLRPIKDLLEEIISHAGQRKGRTSKGMRSIEPTLVEYRNATGALRDFGITWVLFLDLPLDYPRRHRIGVSLT